MIQWLLTGGFIPPLLMITGIFFFLYLKGSPLRHPQKMLRALCAEGATEGISPFRAVMLALAGTLGVGNIVGVANALWIGGAGAIFWMWISSLFAMILKYAEILVAVRHRRTGKQGFFGGAYYYIKDLLESHRLFRLAALLSSLFAVLMILNALSMGCIIQANAIGASMRGVLGVPTWLCGLLLALPLFPILLGGSRGVSALTELLVPIMTAGYLILSAAVLILRRDAIGDAFGRILRDALHPSGVLGGAVGFLTSKALRVGTMRGLLSNEGGCGTAPTAHACANAKNPASQGIWGIFEVFVDTILLCTVTALVILVSYDEVGMLGENGVMMTIRAYSCVLGGWAEWFFAAAILAFGYATVLCWSHYGAESLRFLTNQKRYRYLYLGAVTVCVFVGTVIAPESVWAVADFSIAALTAINLCALILLRKEIKEETELWAGSSHQRK
ncbi:MAG: sodium:alanine symporter family protein [Ruminococcaceae bacterium]|nr:sodium:alanine symporter family protein [Oscillospiraceae bacterium]